MEVVTYLQSFELRKESVKRKWRVCRFVTILHGLDSKQNQCEWYH